GAPRDLSSSSQSDALSVCSFTSSISLFWPSPPMAKHTVVIPLAAGSQSILAIIAALPPLVVILARKPSDSDSAAALYCCLFFAPTLQCGKVQVSLSFVDTRRTHFTPSSSQVASISMAQLSSKVE
ncbi:MAG: hypothetical protein AAF433_05715, partial [Bacteroidota bacterium]